MALSVSPVALPSLPAVVALLSPGHLGVSGQRIRLPMGAAFPAVLAFVVGMDGVFAVAGYLFTEVTVALIRAAVVLHILAAVVLGGLGLRLVLRKATLCNRARAIPLQPGRAFLYGMVFSVSGCPACGPIAVGLGSLAALTGGPLYAVLTMTLFVLGRAAVLLAAAGLGARLLPTGEAVRWARLDLVVGVAFLVASGYYVYRLLHGDVTTAVPGEPGSGVLP
jgi:cytochrome c biogenesis protein CcdA